MLTNAYETQIVQSLGVRIGPEAATATSTSGNGCPFTAMIPGTERAGAAVDDMRSIRWTAEAEARLEKIPSFVRPMARTGIEQFARERGAQEIDEPLLDAAREFFGM